MFKFWFESIILFDKKTLDVKGLNNYVGNLTISSAVAILSNYELIILFLFLINVQTIHVSFIIFYSIPMHNRHIDM